jgi:hypothetical protein
MDYPDAYETSKTGKHPHTSEKDGKDTGQSFEDMHGDTPELRLLNRREQSRRANRQSEP